MNGITKSKQRLFLFAVASLGAYALVAQVLFIRQFMAVFLGNELCISAVLGSWLAGVALGAFVSSFLIHYKKNISINGFFILMGLLIFLCPAQIYAVHAIRLLLHIPAGQLANLTQILLSAFLITLPVSFLIGFSFAFACSVFPTRSCNADTIGAVYIAEAAGSLLAGILFTFLLVPYLGSFSVLAIMGVWLVISITLGWPGRGSLWIRALVLVAILVLLAGAWISGAINCVERKATATRLRGLGFSTNTSVKNNWQLIKSVDSRYQDLTLLRRDGQYVLLENGQVAFVFPDEASYEYRAHFVMVQHPCPQKVLVIGSGASGLLRHILKHPVRELDYVELDPAVIDTIYPFLPSPDQEALADPRVSVSYIDGRRFVKLAKKQYDLILLNTPPPSTVALNRFYTLEFFLEAQRILAPNGILFLSLPSTVHLGKDVASFAGSINSTLRAVFSRVLVTAGGCNMFFAGNKTSLITFDPQVLRARFEKREIKTSYFNPYFYEATDDIWPDKVKFTEDRLQAQGRLNTDSRPITYYLNLILWSHYSGSNIARLFRTIQSIPWLVFAYAFFVPALIYIIWTIFALLGRNSQRSIDRNRRMRTNMLIAIGTTGFAGMALEIIIIFSFQTVCGYVYEKVGLIVASFMVGLVAGAAAVKTRLARSNSISYLWLIGLEVLMLITAIVSYFLIHYLGATAGEFIPHWITETTFYAMTILIGAIVGAEFPLANRIFIHAGGRAIASAAVTDMADHLGAFVGAFFIGIFFIPLFGYSGSCWFVTITKLFTTLILLSQYYK